MKDTAQFGLNKTPTQLHPAMTQAMMDGYDELPPHAEGSATDAFTMRKNYIENSEQLGAVPIPSSLKGTLSAGMQVLKGNSPSVLIDKLGERLAFERSGVRLYGKRPTVPPKKNIPPAACCDFLNRSRYGHHSEMASAYRSMATQRSVASRILR